MATAGRSYFPHAKAEHTMKFLQGEMPQVTSKPMTQSKGAGWSVMSFAAEKGQANNKT